MDRAYFNIRPGKGLIILLLFLSLLCLADCSRDVNQDSRPGDLVEYTGFLKIPGVTSASYDDLFLNSNLQMININQDKYILFRNSRKNFEIILNFRAGFFWKLWDFIIDCLDAGILFTLQKQNNPFASVFIWIILLVIITYIFIKRK